MDIHSKRLVCCADILGFSNKFGKLPTGDKIEKYRNIITAVKSSCHFYQDYTGVEPNFSVKRANFYWFSDFLILFSNSICDDSSHDEKQQISDYIEEDIVDFLRSVKFLFLRSLWYGLPLRGAIDFGEFVFYPDENIVIGESIINTVKLSDCHDWSGIALTPNCSKMLSRYGKAKEYLVSYPVPTKNDVKDELDVIDWTKDSSLQTKTDVKEYILGRFAANCDQIDDRAQKKLENTIKFLELRATT
ncbi:MAG: hypothetical protein JXI32_04830 [Deltaproteobacteria bacterium]|nr:hypothetical protein [Deltaproteobacteria bacterium]